MCPAQPAERRATRAGSPALVDTVVAEATHPLGDEMVSGTVTFKWLEGACFLIQRSHNDRQLQTRSVSSALVSGPAGC